ncbi:acyltransferase family protein [Aestuariicoccus sp. MJ-SS9]|uniref:acyltransferase family protein n=1 Tax=Aestuariicoccus sp. MJ-SS9 TaxID=3079855 RepID=UPI00291019E4|nr:acyltransferase family protein [Aestuariicoccus sp. MJ-SS9]MDU8913704.1 acyltransferase family protein [Aestuariicoccus sp. MJ-SS9]
MTLGEALRSGRTGNLDALRLLLAAAVIVSHAWPLALGPGTPEPLEALTGHSLGGWAVALFFFLSGLLVTASAERRAARGFWVARARRILPGLGAALLVTLALAFASGAHADPAEAAAYFLRALTLVSIEHRLPGAFAANPFPEVVNGPLWSLFHEVAAYAVCALAVAAGVTRSRTRILALAVAASMAAMAGDVLPGRAATFAPLFAAFALGMAAHVFRDGLIMRPGLAVLLLPLVVLAPWPVAVAVLGYASLALALRAPALPLDGDFSFGLYIYGWPVAQTVVHALPGIGPAALAVASLLAALPFAVASWHLVERPVLHRRQGAA